MPSLRVSVGAASPPPGSLFSRLFSSGEELDESASNGLLMAAADGLRVVDLHRPKALNALNADMVATLLPLLQDWQQPGGDVKMVVFRGSGPRAFCAGGDIRFLRDCALGTDGLTVAMAESFFRNEYTMNHTLGTMTEPIGVSICDGIVMGGGVGLSVHGKVRIATENTLFAMPETGIGFFPDVGGTYFLPRLPGGMAVGVFLGLTGARLTGRDAFTAGVATHFVPSSRLEQMEGILAELARQALLRGEETEQESRRSEADAAPSLLSSTLNKALQSLDQIDGESTTAAPSFLQTRAGEIEHCFGGANLTVSEIVARVEELAASQEAAGEHPHRVGKENGGNPAESSSSFDPGAGWAMAAAKELRNASPTSLAVTLSALRRGADLPSLGACLEMEYRIAQRFLRCPDMAAGINAVLTRTRDGLAWGPPPAEGSDELEEYFTDVYGGGLDLGKEQQ